MITADDPAIRHQLLIHEGSRSKPYVDTVGKITIGVGRNLTDVGLSPDEIDLLLTNDLQITITNLQTFPWFAGLDPVRQRVLIDMRFQLGAMGLLHFTNFLTAVSRGDYTQAAKQMLLSLWAQEVPQRAHTLAAAMETGELHI